MRPVTSGKLRHDCMMSQNNKSTMDLKRLHDRVGGEVTQHLTVICWVRGEVAIKY